MRSNGQAVARSWRTRPAGCGAGLSISPRRRLLKKNWGRGRLPRRGSVGGVVEHPAESSLWKHCGIYLNGTRDDFGGFAILVQQWWWGHRAHKWTRLYFCGVEHGQLPEIPYKIGEAPAVIASSRKRQAGRYRPEVTKAEREHTPPELAKWLIAAARLCSPLVSPGECLFKPGMP